MITCMGIDTFPLTRFTVLAGSAMNSALYHGQNWICLNGKIVPAELLQLVAKYTRPQINTVISWLSSQEFFFKSGFIFFINLLVFMVNQT